MPRIHPDYSLPPLREMPDPFPTPEEGVEFQIPEDLFIPNLNEVAEVPMPPLVTPRTPPTPGNNQSNLAERLRAAVLLRLGPRITPVEVKPITALTLSRQNSCWMRLQNGLSAAINLSRLFQQQIETILRAIDRSLD